MTATSVSVVSSADQVVTARLTGDQTARQPRPDSDRENRNAFAYQRPRRR